MKPIWPKTWGKESPKIQILISTQFMSNDNQTWNTIILTLREHFKHLYSIKELPLVTNPFGLKWLIQHPTKPTLRINPNS